MHRAGECNDSGTALTQLNKERRSAHDHNGWAAYPTRTPFCLVPPQETARFLLQYQVSSSRRSLGYIAFPNIWSGHRKHAAHPHHGGYLYRC